jgi:two-component system sensor histidine kinase/response regulator
LKEKDKFFSIIAHDLSSPFQSFWGLTEMMTDDDADYSHEEYVDR